MTLVHKREYCVHTSAHCRRPTESPAQPECPAHGCALEHSQPRRAATTCRLLPVEVVGEAENGPQAVKQVLALLPDVVVMDLQLHTVSASEPTLNGMATIQMIKSRWPAIRIVVLTMYATDRASVLAAGADAFLLKGCPTRELWTR